MLWLPLALEGGNFVMKNSVWPTSQFNKVPTNIF